jgi:hypothetical protein
MFKSKKKSKSKFNAKNSSMKKIVSQGLYEFKNKTNAELILNSVSKDKKKNILPNETWIDDDSSMFYVKNGIAIINKIINVKPNEKQINKKEKIMEEVLILDQPDLVTQNGKIENIVSNEIDLENTNKKNKKNKSKKQNEDVLLTDDGVDTIQLLS